MLHIRKLVAIITQLALVAAFVVSTASATSNGREAITRKTSKSG